MIDAVDARDGTAALAPHAALLPERFWAARTIKPGAFACFVSHRLAWQALVDSGAPAALVVEDDAVLDPAAARAAPAGLTFVNDRMQAWRTAGGGSADPAVLLRALAEAPARVRPAVAPGADGYRLDAATAAALLDATARDAACCGVDWYLLAASAGLPEDPVLDEIRLLRRMLGKRPAWIAGQVADSASVRQPGGFGSVIGHRARVPIDSLRSATI